MDQAEVVNARVRANKSLAVARKEWDEVEARRVALDKAIADADEQKLKVTAAAIAAAKIATPGLTFDEDGLWIDGIPFGQCNTAEQLKVSVALAVHENPRLRVYRISDGEKLTPRNMAIMRDIAAEADAQIIVEYAVTPEDVASGYREVSFLINEGEVAPALKVAS
jgi:hypothetical protein